MMKVASVSNIGPFIKYNCVFIVQNQAYPAGYFLQSDTSMFFINNSDQYSSPFPNFYIRFPVSGGIYWQGSFPGDSTIVAGVSGSCKFYNLNYSPCYSTSEMYDLPHNFMSKSMLLTPKVGLVFGSIDFISDTAISNGSSMGVDACEEIYLINYNLE
jgi:hypothetical protein